MWLWLCYLNIVWSWKMVLGLQLLLIFKFHAILLQHTLTFKENNFKNHSN
jgi:hypothetical protein